MALTRQKLVRWLLDHGFSELPQGPGSHRVFDLDGLKITVSWHGTGSWGMNRRDVTMILRRIARAGFDFEEMKTELLRDNRTRSKKTREALP